MIRVRFGIVLLSFLLVVITAAITTYFQPRKYRATGHAGTAHEQREFQDFRPRRQRRAGASRIRASCRRRTKFSLSREVLNPVVDAQDLQRKWAADGAPVPKEAAYGRLRSMISLKPVRGTDLLELDVMSTDPDEAKKLVDAVAESYQNVRRTNDSYVFRKGQESSNANIETNRQSVDALQAKACRITAARTPTCVIPTRTRRKPARTLTRARSTTKQGEVDNTNRQVAALTSQLNQVSQLQGPELMRALNLLQINDSTIQGVLPKYQDGGFRRGRDAQLRSRSEPSEDRFSAGSARRCTPSSLPIRWTASGIRSPSSSTWPRRRWPA